jgi:hypothetical protein
MLRAMRITRTTLNPEHVKDDSEPLPASLQR